MLQSFRNKLEFIIYLKDSIINKYFKYLIILIIFET